MLHIFIAEIKKLYERLDKIDKSEINAFMLEWQIKDSIGEMYQQLCHTELKKDTGSFYTPYEIVDFMVNDSLNYIDYKNNPYMRILDPSCGGGYFLRSIFLKLEQLAIQAGIENPQQHVIKHNIYGCDVDEIAVMISSVELYLLSGTVSKNISKCDFLIEFDVNVESELYTKSEAKLEFDLILGNPPYMGHKILVGDYRRLLYDKYAQVFYDKADISYCFIKKSIDMLRDNGTLVFFTSRYIVEALNGKGIRHYLLEHGHIDRILDFYGVRVVNGARVDNIILNYTKSQLVDATKLIRLNAKAEKVGSAVLLMLDQLPNEYVKVTTAMQSELDENGFSFLDATEKKIINKIQGNRLEDICTSYQGIITGCDKAFVVDEKEVLQLNKIDKRLLFKWIKNSQISRFKVAETHERIIYSNLIDHEENYIGTLQYIANFKDRLEKRRECQKGSRKWYELQWGRTMKLFTEEKIVFPYKASTNRFAIDRGNCFSADVYALKINDEFIEIGNYTYEYLCAVLNSRLYEFYIKSIAKKLGKDLYDYYPNKIMKLKIPDYISELDAHVRNNEMPDRDRIDSILNGYLGITEEEYAIIKKWC